MSWHRSNPHLYTMIPSGRMAVYSVNLIYNGRGPDETNGEIQRERLEVHRGNDSTAVQQNHCILKTNLISNQNN